MSWSFTVDMLTPTFELPEGLLADMSRAHPLYPEDMQLAIFVAKNAGLGSCTCTGMRAPNPYIPGAELVDISVRGFVGATDFNDTVKGIIRQGPDQPAEANPPDAVSAAIYRQHLDEAEYEGEDDVA